MLRRTKSIVLKEDTNADVDVAYEPSAFDTFDRGTSERGTSERGDSVGAMHAEIERAFTRADPQPAIPPRPAAASAAPQAERRKSERRGMDALRDEALRNVISMVEDKNFGGLRSGTRWRARMPLSRIALLVVAIAAGGVAAMLATQNGQPASVPAAEPVPQVVQEARTRILVAKEAIGIGQRLSPASVEWQEWPAGAVRPEYLTIDMAPNAVGDMAGSVARYELFPGEPIRAEKLAESGQGTLSSVLGDGMRGVSVSVSAAAASGGFILPNDHVDVVLTRSAEAGLFSETILRNVRVLAINAELAGTPKEDEKEGPAVFEGEAIATLELDAVGSEVIVGAATAGQLSLVLRSILDFAEIEANEPRPANQAIRLTSPFWTN